MPSRKPAPLWARSPKKKLFTCEIEDDLFPYLGTNSSEPTFYGLDATGKLYNNYSHDEDGKGAYGRALKRTG